MLFNFCTADGRRGICTAETIKEATTFIIAEIGPCELSIDYGVEDFLNEDFGGIALLTLAGEA